MIITYGACGDESRGAGKLPVRVALSPKDLDAFPSSALSLDPDAVYLLSGGLGGLGRSLATFLVCHLGARKLAFLSRSGVASTSASQLLADLTAHPAQPRVAAYACDVSDLAALEDALALAKSELHGEVKGVVQCAMVLRDVAFANMTWQQWAESTLPKVQGTANLSSLLPDVDFFISLSSFAGVFGNRGQANYAAANCFLDALARHRRQGLRLRSGTTVDLPIMREVGVIAEAGLPEALREWEGPYGIGEAEFHRAMRIAIWRDMRMGLGGDSSQESGGHDLDPRMVMVLGLATGASARIARISTPFYLDDDVRFSILSKTDWRQYQKLYPSSGSKGRGGGSDDFSNQRQERPQSIQVLLSNAPDHEAASKIVTEALVERVAAMQRVDVTEIDPARVLHSYGVDSLVSVDIVSWATKEVKSKVAVFDVMAGIPITALGEKIASKSALVKSPGSE